MNQAASANTAGRVFWPRVSEVIDDLAETIQQPPERPLDDREKAEVLQFEKELFAGRYKDEQCETGLADVPTAVNTSYGFAPSYFLTEKGAGAMAALYPGYEAPPDETAAAGFLRSIPASFLKDKKEQLEKLAGDSMRYAKGRYAEAAKTDIDIENIPTVTINRDPAVLIAKINGLYANRRFIRTVRADLQQSLREHGDLAVEAKLMVTDIYRDRVNAMLAEMYPGLQQLLQQVDAQPQEDRQQLLGLLSPVAPMVNVARMALASEDIQPAFVRRLDYVRNGAGIDKEGRLTPIHSRMYEDAAVLNARADNAEPTDTVFTPEEIERLGQITIDADAMVELTNTYMRRIGLQGWEAEMRANRDSLKVSGVQEKVLVSAKFSKTPTQTEPTAGTVAIIEHEVGGEKPGHVMQHVNARNNDQALQIGKSPKYKGKRASALREPGGLTAEADAMKRYFGQERKMQVAYGKAMEVLLGGGSVCQAAAAFAIEHSADRPAMDEAQKDELYQLAADRVLRLRRNGGHNSQPLNYVEAATVRRVLETLDDDTQKVILAEANFDPVDMLRLHRYGLLPTNTDHLFQPAENPTNVMAELLREMFAKN